MYWKLPAEVQSPSDIILQPHEARSWFNLRGFQDQAIHPRQGVWRDDAFLPRYRWQRLDPRRATPRPESPLSFLSLRFEASISSCGKGPCLLPGVADMNEITKDYRDHVLKFVPTLRSYNLHRAANYLETWVSGRYVAAPLLDISAPLDKTLASVLHILLAAAEAYVKVLFQQGRAGGVTSTRLRRGAIF